MSDIFYQDDGERLYYCMNFNTHPHILDGDTITGVPSVASEIRGGFTSDLIIENIVSSGLYVCMDISGGTRLKTYKIEVTAPVSNGRILEGDGFIKMGD